jgi:outer membrane immunogenic protein
MKSKFIGAAVLAMACASPAWAQQEEEAFFNGPRIEALFGYDKIKASIPADSDLTGDSEDIFYGAAIGYDYSNGWLLIGAEAEIARSGHKFRETFSDVDFGDSVLSGTLQAKTGTEFYVGGRIGFVGHRTAVYVKAGYARSNANLTANGTVNGLPESARVDLDLDGLRLGVGAEYQLGKRAYIKAEYRYTDFSGGDLSFLGESFNLGPILDNDLDLTRHQAIVGAGLRF